MIKYSDVYVSILARGLCQPGEQFVSACAVNHQPWWSFAIPLFKHALLLVATTHRLIALDHRKGLMYDRLDRAQSFAWHDVGAFKLGGLLTTKVVIRDRSNRVVVRGKVTGLLGPLPNNGASVRTLLQTWEQHARLAPPRPMATLPRHAAA